MDMQHVFNIILVIFSGSAGVILKGVWDILKEMREDSKGLNEDISSLKVLIAGQYITRTEHEKFAVQVFNKLDEINRGKL
jgi:UDP-N-acetylmuramyl pentapeptide phosphotransferase/UDP-N-acetylglucosamine-1-phosphate transferase